MCTNLNFLIRSVINLIQMETFLCDQLVQSFVSSYPKDYWPRIFHFLLRYAINSIKSSFSSVPSLSDLEQLSYSAKPKANDALKGKLHDIRHVLHKLDKKMVKVLKEHDMFQEAVQEPRVQDKETRQRSRAISDMGPGLTAPSGNPCFEVNQAYYRNMHYNIS